ncbi:YdcF family protein [Curtobacterium sp. MCBA15_004]|uniref:YdcF family protein n=1 Tax=Curtobacterium sp. MCBA15_004 TaxID=1898733 RepID=UPI0008DDAE69|nr:YdcF family protein [Curtobacterium sp. MCBA15_004]WIA96830.1 YdcF family protein [Curtobacterium sp. MCBA15_004]
MFLLVVAAVFLIAYLVCRRRDPRMLRNGVFLTTAVVFGVLGGLVVAADWSLPAVVALGLLALALPISVVVFGVALVANGVTMLRKEGRSLGNQLSLLAGVAVLVLPVVAVVLVVRFGVVGVTVAALLALVSAYASAAFVSFALYSVVYGRMRHGVAPTAVVVHGAGLRADGTVTPLLRGRLDRGVQAWRAEVARGNRPLLVPSGGQGSDEVRAEATAMREYLLDQGVPAEDRSTTTRENIERSVELLRDAGRTGPLLLVTSDYHVLRTASLARRLGADAQVVGSRTARYYVPSAFLREFVALLVEHRWVSVVALGPFVALAAAIAVGELTGLAH